MNAPFHDMLQQPLDTDARLTITIDGDPVSIDVPCGRVPYPIVMDVLVRFIGTSVSVVVDSAGALTASWMRDGARVEAPVEVSIQPRKGST